MHGAFKGLMLGGINVVLIAIGLAGYDRSNVAGLVILFGGLPGLFAGTVLGAVAHVIDDARAPIRIGVLVLPAVGVVFLLAKQFGMEGLAPISCIPTTVAALILERWTRKRPEPPPVPAARVH